MCLHQQLMKKTVCVSFVLTIYKLGLRERERERGRNTSLDPLKAHGAFETLNRKLKSIQ